jgi:hypothetical protein
MREVENNTIEIPTMEKREEIMTAIEFVKKEIKDAKKKFDRQTVLNNGTSHTRNYNRGYKLGLQKGKLELLSELLDLLKGSE